MPETYHSDVRASNKNPQTLKSGDTITTDEILGIAHEGASTVEKVGWLRGAESRFGSDVFDCRGFALHHMTTTGDPDIAETFLRNRTSDGKSYIDEKPEHPIEADTTFRFELGVTPIINGPLFKAQQMEEKWDIYHYDGVLYFVRSWTGTLAHIAHCRVVDGILEVSSVVTDASALDERDVMFFVREVFYLIVSHVLDVVYPHPLMACLPMDDESIVHFSFARYGRRGYFGSKTGPPFHKSEKSN